MVTIYMDIDEMETIREFLMRNVKDYQPWWSRETCISELTHLLWHLNEEAKQYASNGNSVQEDSQSHAGR